MTYEEQLSVAKFRSERDMARQELVIERHRRKLAESAAAERETVRAEDREAAAWVREMGGLEEVRKRLMPEGMEWPRYESGEPVMLGSLVADDRGGSTAAISFELSDDRVYVRDFEGFPSQVLAVGERVKRPEADSWERIEDDATKQPYSYCAERGLDDDALPTNEKFARDLVRRCKALAERGEQE